MTVLTEGVVPGQLEASALAAIVVRRMRERYPDFALTTISTTAAAGGTQQSRFSARWTNRWSQPMRAQGVIVSAPRGADTVYSVVAGQAQELVYAALERVFDRVLGSFRAPPER